MFRFHSELGYFLTKTHRETVISRDCARAATLKHAVDALGVPHSEVGRITCGNIAFT